MNESRGIIMNLRDFEGTNQFILYFIFYWCWSNGTLAFRFCNEVVSVRNSKKVDIYHLETSSRWFDWDEGIIQIFATYLYPLTVSTFFYENFRVFCMFLLGEPFFDSYCFSKSHGIGDFALWNCKKWGKFNFCRGFWNLPFDVFFWENEAYHFVKG